MTVALQSLLSENIIGYNYKLIEGLITRSEREK